MKIHEAARCCGIRPHTLRYYEEIGLIRRVGRDSSGIRDYSGEDLRWLEFLVRLRATGMKISKMQEYARLRYQGDETAHERKNLLESHLHSLDEEIARLTEMRRFVAEKIEIYDRMVNTLHEQHESCK